MISVEADFSMRDLDDIINGELHVWFDDLKNSLSITGRNLVDKARAKTKDDGGFGNITWNLRASIGMCIVDENGRIVETYFPPIGKGEHGHELGKETAERLAIYGRRADQMYIVFVAGEKYADIVQDKGKDVIKYVIGDHLEQALNSIM